MKVLFVTCASKSVMYLLTPLAWAMRVAGHQVYVASSPDVADDVVKAGHIGVEVGPKADFGGQIAETAVAPPWPERPKQSDYARDDPHRELSALAHELLPMVCPDSMFDDLVDFARAWEPDLVLWDQMSLTGAVAARASGAASARVLYGHDGLVQLRSAFLSPRDMSWTDPREDPLRNWLERSLKRFGLEFDEELVTGQWTIDPTPSWLWRPSSPVQYLPVRQLPFNGPGTVPDWLLHKPSRKRICLTLGMTHRETHGIEAPAERLLQAVGGLDVEVIATLNERQMNSVSEIPDNVRVVDFVPLNALLPTCSAVVHHGGTGTFAAALEHGVPQLIIPSTFWNESWFGPVALANGLHEQGAGIYVANSDKLSAAGLREHLERVLTSPSFGESAAKARAELLGVPTPADIVPALERLTERYRRH